MINFNKTLKVQLREWIRRTGTEETLSFLFNNNECLDAIFDKEFDSSLRGQVIEFLRQEYLHFNGYTQLDKHLKVINNFAYAGKDRADIRAFKTFDEDNTEVRVESGKVKLNKSLGVGSGELEGILLEALDVRNKYLGNQNARIILGVLASNEGVTKDVEAWFNGKKEQHRLHKLEVFNLEDYKKWWYYLSIIYQRHGWKYRESITDIKSSIIYKYHQERLQIRWVPAMIKGKLKLLIVWGCRSGKTFGSLGLIEKYAKVSQKTLKVCIVTAIPSLFKDWEDSIKKIFSDSALIHRHRSGSKPPKTNKHLFILSSSQMLNPDDKDLGVDKETNNAVIYSQYFDLLVYDEGHQGLTAENTFTQVIKKIKHEHRIGLTATPFRNGLLNNSVFDNRDVFDYWDQMKMKTLGHPDYQNVPERFLLTIKPSEKLKKIFKQYDLLEMGANLNTIYSDPGHMDAAIAILEESVFKQTLLLGDSKKHKIKDIIIRANSIEGSKTLLDALRNYVNPITGKKLDGHLFGLATGSKSDLPGVPVAFDGLNADQFKSAVDSFFSQKIEGNIRKVLIVVDQGIVGHTFETVNTTIDLTTGVSLISKYQFWDRGGTAYVYPDGYEKNTYYHFDLDPFRLYQMGQEMLNGKRSDKQNTTSEFEFFELLNLFEVTGGTSFELVNQTAFKEKVNQMIATNKLSQILPNPNSLIVNDGTFSDYAISKLKNGFGSTGFGEEDHDDELDKSLVGKRLNTSKGINSRKALINLDKSTVNAIERVINVLPMLALFEEIETRNTLTLDK